MKKINPLKKLTYSLYSQLCGEQIYCSIYSCRLLVTSVNESDEICKKG